jgi:hypothetical protein
MDPQTVELLTKLAGPAAAVFAAITAASVAVGFGISQSRNAKRQAKIANDKLALDLFQKRIHSGLGPDLGPYWGCEARGATAHEMETVDTERKHHACDDRVRTTRLEGRCSGEGV